LALISNLFADFDFKPIETELLKVDDNYGYIKNSPKIKLGASGVVIADFNSSKSIIARASVVQKESDMAKLEFRVFSDLEQKALPLPNILPQAGDKFILNFLYDRALIIAPDKKSYDEILAKYPQIYFSHIDIFGAQLIRYSKESPKFSDFRKFCADNAVGLIVFALDQKLKFVDCQGFELVYETPFTYKAQKVELPFYSRIQGYRSSIFDLGSEKIKDFYKYYEALIKPVRNSQ